MVIPKWHPVIEPLSWHHCEPAIKHFCGTPVCEANRLNGVSKDSLNEQLGGNPSLCFVDTVDEYHPRFHFVDVWS